MAEAQLQAQLIQVKAERDEAREAAEGTTRAALASAVSIKLPTFWPQKAVLWFAQTEAQFDLKGITQDGTKHAYVVAALGDDTATLVMDLLENPPAQNKYEALKARLKEAFEMTDSEKAGRILDSNGLGDAKPSELLAKLLALVPAGQDPGFLFREVFLRQLPTDVRAHLAQTDKTGVKTPDLRALAKEADKHFISTGAKVASATEEVNAASGAPAQRAPSRFKAKIRQDPGGKKASKFCWIHAKFGASAYKCIQPCDFKPKISENESAGRQ